jgi:hypothetical protein
MPNWAAQRGVGWGWEAGDRGLRGGCREAGRRVIQFDGFRDVRARTKSERMGRCSSSRVRFSVDCMTNTPAFKLSVHTGDRMITETPERGFVKVDGHRFGFARTGRGRSIVLLHGNRKAILLTRGRLTACSEQRGE